MSGRSAYVRRKKTNTTSSKDHKSKSPSPTSLDHDSFGLRRETSISIGGPLGTGVSTATGRLLRFSNRVPSSRFEGGSTSSSDPLDHGDQLRLHPSCSGGSGISNEYRARMDRGLDQLNLEACIAAPVPIIQTEDVSGIERSGLRSTMDKRSDGVRKGIAKTFAFRHKGGRSLQGDYPEGNTTTAHILSSTPSEENECDHLTSSIYPPVLQPALPRQLPDEPVVSTKQRASENRQRFHYPSSPPDRIDHSGVPPPSCKLPPIPSPSREPRIRKWTGGRRRRNSLWDKLQRDPELWDPNGDVLVFLGRRGQTPPLLPSFRVSSSVIKTTGSRLLVSMLQDGHVADGGLLDPSPTSPTFLRSDRNDGSYFEQRPLYGAHSATIRHDGHPTPPLSETETTSVSDAIEGHISYEMYFPPPVGLSPEAQLRHQITTRNVFALLGQTPSIVGLSLFRSLADLHARMIAYMPADCDVTGQVVRYLSFRGFDDVRDDLEAAVALLAWSEHPDVLWEEGWREAFAHCVGMYDDGTLFDRYTGVAKVKPVTRALVRQAHQEMRHRLRDAEERLAEIAYSDMWPAGSRGPARMAADRLREMLVAYLERQFGTWPPPLPISMRHTGHDIEEQTEELEDEETRPWLTRTLAMKLQRDFGALYEHLADREAEASSDSPVPGKLPRLEMSMSMGGDMFSSPIDQGLHRSDLGLTDILFDWDDRQHFPHMPYPYPLLPAPCVASAGSPPATPVCPRVAAAMEGSGKSQTFADESTDIFALDGLGSPANNLVETFSRFEKTEAAAIGDTVAARLGFWVIVYGVLQTLASVAVDSPDVRYSKGVDYHLCPQRVQDVKAVSSWKGASSGAAAASLLPIAAVSHELSYCWLAAHLWRSERSDDVVAEDDDDDDDEEDDEQGVNDGDGGQLGEATETPDVESVYDTPLLERDDQESIRFLMVSGSRRRAEHGHLVL